MASMARGFVAFMAACLVAGAGLADDTKSRVIEGWGRVVDPDGDCTVKAEKGKLTITVPATNHNLSPAFSLNAPRVLREVEGDFIVTVKVSGEFKPGEGSTVPRGYPFNGAGVLVWADDRNYLRLERNIWWVPDVGRHACYPPLVEYYRDGEYRDTNPRGTAAEFFKGRSTHLRLERTGEKITASYSHDGKDWTAAKEVTVDLPKKVQVGVAAVNTSDKLFTVEFEDIKIFAGK